VGNVFIYMRTMVVKELGCCETSRRVVEWRYLPIL